MILTILFFGFLFGAILQYARLNSYNVISGLAMREDFTVPKAMAIAIGVGTVLISIEIALGMASYHVKPFEVGGIVLGGILFGMGMALLGYCPGTLIISLGEGSLDALTGIAGGLSGGLLYSVVFPFIKPFLGPNLGSISLNSLMGNNSLFYLIALLFAGSLIGGAFFLHRKEKTSNYKWLYAGIALAMLNAVVFVTALTNRPIGASTAFPYFADLLAGTMNNEYFNNIKGPGHWELIFLAGSFLAGFVISFLKNEFKLTLIHENWKKHKGNSAIKRIIWAFAGGFILILGARLAGGCTSGHVLSGGMQLAISSLVFAVFVFPALLLTGKVFYRKDSCK